MVANSLLCIRDWKCYADQFCTQASLEWGFRTSNLRFSIWMYYCVYVCVLSCSSLLLWRSLLAKNHGFSTFYPRLSNPVYVFPLLLLGCLPLPLSLSCCMNVVLCRMYWIYYLWKRAPLHGQRRLDTLWQRLEEFAWLRWDYNAYFMCAMLYTIQYILAYVHMLLR